MKVCFPVESNQGLNSAPYGHFGSAPMFLMVETDTNEVTVIKNGDLGHEHGKCQPIQALEGVTPDAVVVGGIGQGAILKLNSLGIRVFKASAGTLEDNLEALKSNGLVEFNKDHACNHHDCGGHH